MVKARRRLRADNDSDDEIPLGKLHRIAPENDASEYELRRLSRVQANAAFLSSLDLPKPPPRRVAKPRAPRPKPQQSSRSSSRIRQLPAPSYVEERTLEDSDGTAATNELQEAITAGYRSGDGRWRGECFGEVEGVPEGTVFGLGDFQRLGRQEMVDTGFFRPFVTPEWVNPSGGCYSLILNNDNGLSTDKGSVIEYAGSGGRRRGQNRTAPQCFNHSWDNLTNAALKHNHEHKIPVRVLRGPKLQGRFGTGDCGGGYRYDGLYDVVGAEMKACSRGKLLTAMFTLHKRS